MLIAGGRCVKISVKVAANAGPPVPGDKRLAQVARIVTNPILQNSESEYYSLAGRKRLARWQWGGRGATSGFGSG